MFKLFYKRLKDQTGLAVTTVLIITGLISLGASLWSLGTASEEYKREQIDVTQYGDIKNNPEINPSEAYEQNKRATAKILLKAGETGAGAYDDTGLLGLVVNNTDILKLEEEDAASEKRKTVKLDKLEPPPASQEELNRLMQLTEDELDRILEELGAMDMTDPNTGKEIDFGYSDEEINRLLEETGNLDSGIKKMVEKKVELNADSETTPEEKKTIVDETVKNIQKAEDNSTKVDLNSWVKTILKGTDKLADQKLVDLRYKLKRNELSYDYNFSIIQKYEEYQAKGQGITDTAELAEAKRRVADLYDETRIIEAQIKELEDAKQIAQDSEVASESEEAKGLTDANKEETKTQPDESEQEVTPDEQEKIVTLCGTVWSTFDEKITMIINFSTGEITGNVIGNNDEKASVNGKITLPDNKISVIVTGTWQSSDGEVQFSYDLIGTYYPETNSASGSNAANTGKWSVSPCYTENASGVIEGNS
jgi:hypothetical protein